MTPETHSIALTVGEFAAILSVAVAILIFSIGQLIYVNIKIAKLEVGVADLKKTREEDREKIDTLVATSMEERVLLSRELMDMKDKLLDKFEGLTKITTEIRIKCGKHFPESA